MSTELEKREASLVPNLATGELLDLSSADSGDIAHALFAIREKEYELKEMKKLVGDELNRRLDAEAQWTQHWGAFDVKGSSPQPTREADMGPLMEALEGLVAEGLISQQAAQKAVKPKVDYIPKWGAIDAIRKVSPEVRERIDPHIREVEKRRYAPRVEMVRPEPSEEAEA